MWCVIKKRRHMSCHERSFREVTSSTLDRLFSVSLLHSKSFITAASTTKGCKVGHLHFVCHLWMVLHSLLFSLMLCCSRFVQPHVHDVCSERKSQHVPCNVSLETGVNVLRLLQDKMKQWLLSVFATGIQRLKYLRETPDEPCDAAVEMHPAWQRWVRQWSGLSQDASVTEASPQSPPCFTTS